MGKKLFAELVDAVGALHALDAHDLVYERVHDGRTGHFDGHFSRHAAVPGGCEVHRADAQFEIADDDLGDVVGHARGVGRHDADRDAERPFGRLGRGTLAVRTTIAGG